MSLFRWLYVIVMRLLMLHEILDLLCGAKEPEGQKIGMPDNFWGSVTVLVGLYIYN